MVRLALRVLRERRVQLVRQGHKEFKVSLARLALLRLALALGLALLRLCLLGPLQLRRLWLAALRAPTS